MNIRLKPDNTPTQPGYYVYMVGSERVMVEIIQSLHGLLFKSNDKEFYIEVHELAPSVLWSDVLEFCV